MANYVSFENAQVLVQGINDKIDSKFSELGGAYIAYVVRRKSQTAE